MSEEQGPPGLPAVTPNDVLRFFLEVAALVALAIGGWTVGGGGAGGAALAVALTFVAGGAWGTFRVDGDPRRAPVPVPGVVRLAIELVFFGSAAGMLVAIGQGGLAAVFAAVLVAHYAMGHRRVLWLIRHPGRYPGE